jgi:hypothetical protein
MASPGVTADPYVAALTTLGEAGVAFLVGGGYALERYAGLSRDPKDLDVFVLAEHSDAALGALATAGYATETRFPHWLGKAFVGDRTIDLIWGSGNGCAPVDEEWFEHAVDGVVLGLPVKLCPPEETIWSKSFVMERERYDGADVIHLLRACGATLDWARLLRRFGPHWRVLLSHLMLYGFVYPGERGQVPAGVLDRLLRRLRREMTEEEPGPRACRGTLLSRAQYLVDIESWGYRDARLEPPCAMTVEDIAGWTRAIEVPAPRGVDSDEARGDR